jgi:hypothetical protein
LVFGYKASTLTQAINGYYTDSSLMHAITGRQVADTYSKRNKFVALLTIITYCSIGSTDGAFIDRCSQDPNRVGLSHAMNFYTVRKTLCGRSPIESIWLGVHSMITTGQLKAMPSEGTNRDMGVLPQSLKYWLINCIHTRHIMLP